MVPLTVILEFLVGEGVCVFCSVCARARVLWVEIASHPIIPSLFINKSVRQTLTKNPLQEGTFKEIIVFWTAQRDCRKRRKWPCCGSNRPATPESRGEVSMCYSKLQLVLPRVYCLDVFYAFWKNMRMFQ